MEIYVVFERPTDYPESFVLRRQVAGTGVVWVDPEPVCVATTLAEVRENVPRGLVCMSPDPDDPANIVEVWL